MAEKAFRGLRALVVEDEALGRAGYTATLRQGGFNTQETESVEEALEIIDRTFFDLAWIDLGLPFRSGDEVVHTQRLGKQVIERIRSKGDPTAVVIVTAIYDAEVATDFLKEFSADEYVTKRSILERSYGYVFEVIKRGVDKYERAKAVDYGVASLALFGKEGDSFFFDQLNRTIKGKTSVDMLHAAITAVCEKCLPIVSRERVSFIATGAEVMAEVWSRGLGSAIKIRFSAANSERLPKAAMHVFERGNLRVSIEESDSEFAGFKP